MYIIDTVWIPYHPAKIKTSLSTGILKYSGLSSYETPTQIRSREDEQIKRVMLMLDSWCLIKKTEIDSLRRKRNNTMK